MAKLKLKRRKTQHAGAIKNEISASEFIPYDCHWNDHTIITKDQELLATIKLEGFSFETADDEDLDVKKHIRNTLFKSIAKPSVSMWSHIIRRREKASLEAEYDNAFCSTLDKKWHTKHVDDENFINELYITIVVKKDTTGIAKIENFIANLAQKADKELEKESYKQLQRDLEEVIGRVMGSMRDYHPRLLGLKKRKRGTYSEILEFLGSLVNCGVKAPVLVPSNEAARYLPNQRIYFGRDAIEIKDVSGRSRFAGTISIKEYPPFTGVGMVDAFLKLPFELIITQMFLFDNRAIGIQGMQVQQDRLRNSGDKGISQMEELSSAMDMATSGHAAFGKFGLSILVIEENKKRLEAALSIAQGELVNFGINPLQDKAMLQAVFWSQLPANFEYLARISKMHTLNLSGFLTLHNFPVGKEKDNHWGDAVTLLETTSGTPYFFNFHVRDVGHTTIIGPTGAGKTVLMNFLCAQAQKFNGRMFFFDKDRGAEIFIRAIGGNYTVIDPAEGCGFNPLQQKNTPENARFLEEWIAVMAQASFEQDISPEESELISEAVRGNFKLEKKQRRLPNILPFLGLEKPGSIASRLRMWHSGETHSGLFDNPRDTIDFTKGNVFGFEMGKVLGDGKSLGPALLYLFHRIQESLDGTPTMIVLDEAWALIDNDIFAPKIKDWLKVLRKLNAMVIFATQTVEDLGNSAISDTLVQQTATQIFLANAKATPEYKKMFMLSDREFEIIRTTNPQNRYFLVKQGDDVVIARVDLSGMNDEIAVLSGRAETVRLLDAVRAEHGDDPDTWLPIFTEKARLLAS